MPRPAYTLSRAAPFALLLAACATGIGLATRQPWPIWLIGSAVALAAALLSVCLAINNRTWAWVWACVLFLVLGIGRYELSRIQPSQDPLLQQHGRHVALEGTIVDEPDMRTDFVNLRLRPLRVVDDAGGQVTNLAAHNDASLVLVKVPKENRQQWQYGQTLRAFGMIDAPPRLGTFDYREYLARQNVLSWLPRPQRVELITPAPSTGFWVSLYAIKNQLRRSTQHAVPAPESAFLNGILIGDDNDIAADLREAFRRTGTSHIVAISGFNVSIVIAMVVPLLGQIFNPRRAAIIAIPAIVFYTLLVGASASVVRAALMAIIGLVGQMLWRRGFTLNTLCAAALLMLLWNPNTLFDGGFQLSFAATVGLVLYLDVIEARVQSWLLRRFSRNITRRLVGIASTTLLGTLAANITTLPLLLVLFNQLSLVSPLANALVLPLQPAAMILGGLASLFGLVSQPLGTLLGWLAYVPLTLTLRIVSWLSTWPWASMPVYGFGAAAAAVYYVALFWLTAFAAQPSAVRQAAVGAARTRLGTWLVLIGLLAGTTLGGLAWYLRPDGKLHVTLRGNSALVITPSGQRVVLGGAGVLDNLDRAAVPWNKTVAVLVLPSHDARAYGDALPIAQRYTIQKLYVPPLPANPNAEAVPKEWTDALVNVTQVMTATEVTATELEPGVMLHVMPQLGGNISAKISFGAINFDIVGRARPIQATLSRNSVIFMAQRFADVPALQALAPRWVIWADSDAHSSTANWPATGMRMVSLRDVDVIEFVSDGKSLSAAR